MSLLRPIYHLHSRIDKRLKFPHLKQGDIGIQIGFDMAYAPTSDLFKMSRRVGPNGLVIGVDPDPANHRAAQVWMKRKGIDNVRLVQKATYRETATLQLQLGQKPSWNQVTAVPLDNTAPFQQRTVDVQADTVDQIIAQEGIEVQTIRHINITNNGAEYATLQGMNKLFDTANHLSITLVAGRQDPSGLVDGRPDFEVCLELLQRQGFQTTFNRMNQLLWWGFCTKLLLNRKWIYGRTNYGVIFAAKGQSIPWYQSFS